MEAWLKPTDGPGRALVSYAAPGSDNEFLLTRTDDVRLFVDGASVYSGIELVLNTWSHVVVSWNGATGETRFYLNGAHVSTTTIAGTEIADGGALIFGEEQDSLGGGFDPSQAYLSGVDEVRIWNTIRTESEIADAMNDSLTGTEPGLALYYPMLAGALGDDLAGDNDATVSATGASESSDFPQETIRDVSVVVGAGTGTLGLDVLANGLIQDLEGNLLAVPFSASETYTVVPPPEPPFFADGFESGDTSQWSSATGSVRR